MFNIHFKTKWKRRDIILLLERLEMYLSSGLEIDRALQICKQGLSKKQSSNIESLLKSVQSGISFSKSLHSFIGTSDTISGLIKHGELSGSLAKSLSTSKNLLEKEDELFKKCISAMTYPIVIGIFATLLIIGLIHGVMSQIIPLLKSLQIKLPLVTKIVIAISEIITKQGVYIFVGTAIAVIVFRILIKKSVTVRHSFQVIIGYIPIIGTLLYNYNLAVFLHSCGALIESGLPVGDAYTRTVATVNLIELRLFLEKQISSISNGQTLGAIIVNKKIPHYVPSLLNAGEASGTLGLSIIRAGNILDREIDHTLKRLTALIEPMMMAGMGCIVGTIALSIMIPIYSLSSAFQK